LHVLDTSFIATPKARLARGAEMPDIPGVLTKFALRRLRYGTLKIDGIGSLRAGSGAPLARVTVNDERAFRAWRSGSKGLAASYVDGWWDSPDLTCLIRLLWRNLKQPLEWLDRAGEVLSGPASLALRVLAPSPATDRSRIEAHYDLPVELFEAMLDDTMTYSCAIFERDDTELRAAQLAKLDRVCRTINLGPNDHLLEIGTGWGSFAMYAARQFGCRVTTTTISSSQLAVARKRVAEAGLADQVEVLALDWRELRGTFSKIVSIEMIEAVDWRRHEEFFSTLDRLLDPRGQMLLQAIVIEDRSFERAKFHRDFIRSGVFPGGCIPSVTALMDAMTKASSLRLYGLLDIGQHYATTLHCWAENLAKNWPGEVCDLDGRRRRSFELYLAYCEAAFLERHISDVQMHLVGADFRAGYISPT
jgi:cyclopropane-fatty-acyl-phospholipid synthase